ncbi:mCG148474 [Mus musculus]|jgi:hypothetical protein|nr:mCG148474 [Mus musculus]
MSKGSNLVSPQPIYNPTFSYSSNKQFPLRFKNRSLMVGCEHPHLYWSGAGRTSQGTAITGSCQQALLGISNSVWVWCLHVGWIPRWGSLWMAFPSVSALFFVPAFPLDRYNSGLKFLRWVGGPIPTGGCAYPLDMVSTGTISPLLGVLANVIPIESWEPLVYLASGTF